MIIKYIYFVKNFLYFIKHYFWTLIVLFVNILRNNNSEITRSYGFRTTSNDFIIISFIVDSIIDDDSLLRPIKFPYVFAFRSTSNVERMF